MNKYVSIALTFVISFLITGGGAYVTATANNADITTPVIVSSIVLGLVQGAKAVQDLMKVPPP